MKTLRLALVTLAVILITAATPWGTLADKYLALYDEWNPEPLNYNKAFYAPFEKAKEQRKKRAAAIAVATTNSVAEEVDLSVPTWTLLRHGKR